MMTETTTRSTEATPSSPPPSRRRRLLSAVVAVVALAAVLGAFLVHRSVSRDLLTATEGNAIGRFPGEDIESDFGERDEVKVAYQDGEAYSFEFTVNNPTRWSVRVTGFPVTPDLGMLQPTGFSVDTTPFDSPDRAFEPFRPFTIRSGEAAMVQVKAHFANCDRFGPGHSDTLVSLPVRYRALWATQTRDIELPTLIRVDAPETCPVP